MLRIVTLKDEPFFGDEQVPLAISFLKREQRGARAVCTP